ncbi:hypothetical protein JCM8097_008755 [Rhodosporidiobolus ruineniae]
MRPRFEPDPGQPRRRPSQPFTDAHGLEHPLYQRQQHVHHQHEHQHEGGSASQQSSAAGGGGPSDIQVEPSGRGGGGRLAPVPPRSFVPYEIWATTRVGLQHGLTAPSSSSSGGGGGGGLRPSQSAFEGFQQHLVQSPPSGLRIDTSSRTLGAESSAVYPAALYPAAVDAHSPTIGSSNLSPSELAEIGRQIAATLPVLPPSSSAPPQQPPLDHPQHRSPPNSAIRNPFDISDLRIVPERQSQAVREQSAVEQPYGAADDSAEWSNFGDLLGSDFDQAPPPPLPQPPVAYHQYPYPYRQPAPNTCSIAPVPVQYSSSSAPPISPVFHSSTVDLASDSQLPLPSQLPYPSTTRPPTYPDLNFGSLQGAQPQPHPQPSVPQPPYGEPSTGSSWQSSAAGYVRSQQGHGQDYVASTSDSTRSSSQATLEANQYSHAFPPMATVAPVGRQMVPRSHPAGASSHPAPFATVQPQHYPQRQQQRLNKSAPVGWYTGFGSNYAPGTDKTRPCPRTDRDVLIKFWLSNRQLSISQVAVQQKYTLPSVYKALDAYIALDPTRAKSKLTPEQHGELRRFRREAPPLLQSADDSASSDDGTASDDEQSDEEQSPPSPPSPPHFPGGSERQLTLVERKAILDHYIANPGITISKLADRFGCTPAIVSRTLSRREYYLDLIAEKEAAARPPVFTRSAQHRQATMHGQAELGMPPAPAFGSLSVASDLPAPPPMDPAAVARRRGEFLLEERLAIIEYSAADPSLSPAQIAAQFACDEAVVARTLKNQAFWLHVAQEGVSDRDQYLLDHAASGRKPWYVINLATRLAACQLSFDSPTLSHAEIGQRVGCSESQVKETLRWRVLYFRLDDDDVGNDISPAHFRTLVTKFASVKAGLKTSEAGAAPVERTSQTVEGVAGDLHSVEAGPSPSPFDVDGSTGVDAPLSPTLSARQPSVHDFGPTARTSVFSSSASPILASPDSGTPLAVSPAFYPPPNLPSSSASGHLGRSLARLPGRSSFGSAPPLSPVATGPFPPPASTTSSSSAFFSLRSPPSFQPALFNPEPVDAAFISVYDRPAASYLSPGAASPSTSPPPAGAVFLHPPGQPYQSVYSPSSDTARLTQPAPKRRRSSLVEEAAQAAAVAAEAAQRALAEAGGEAGTSGGGETKTGEDPGETDWSARWAEEERSAPTPAMGAALSPGSNTLTLADLSLSPSAASPRFEQPFNTSPPGLSVYDRLPSSSFSTLVPPESLSTPAFPSSLAQERSVYASSDAATASAAAGSASTSANSAMKRSRSSTGEDEPPKATEAASMIDGGGEPEQVEESGEGGGPLVDGETPMSLEAWNRSAETPAFMAGGGSTLPVEGDDVYGGVQLGWGGQDEW